MRWLAMALAGLGLLVLVACSGGAGQTPENVAIAYTEAVYKGDAEKALSYVYVPEDREIGSEEMLTGKMKQAVAKAAAEADRKGGLKNVEVTKSEIDDPNGTGVVHVVAHFKNDGSQSADNRLRVIRQNKQWKINL